MGGWFGLVYLTDKYGLSHIDPVAWRKALENRKDNSWQQISDEEIELCQCPFANMSDIEFHYYLPAHLVYALHKYQKLWWQCCITTSIITCLNIHVKHRLKGDLDNFDYTYGLFSQSQLTVLLDWLDFFVHLSNQHFSVTLDDFSQKNKNAQNFIINLYYRDSLVATRDFWANLLD